VTFPRTNQARRAQPGAFTLIELLCVMALLVAVISFAAPSLKNFFHGRTLESEAQRLLALTRAGQERAISEGVPVILWVDSKSGYYGLVTDSSFDDKDNDPKAMEFPTRSDVSMDVLPGTRQAPSPTTADGSSYYTATKYPTKTAGSAIPEIRFQPDGTIDYSSPQAIMLVGWDGATLYVTQSRTHLNYEIRNSPN
jgi:prepilin-type N-terminal cleavage/methylation domain-containing protein